MSNKKLVNLDQTITTRNNIIDNSSDEERESSASSAESGQEQSTSTSSSRPIKRPRGLEYKTSLPLETRRALILRVFKFGEHDNFRAACNSNQSLYGRKGTQLRRRVQFCRNNFIALKKENPQKFDELFHSFFDRREKEVSPDEEKERSPPPPAKSNRNSFSSPQYGSFLINTTPNEVSSIGTSTSSARINKVNSPLKKVDLFQIMSGKAKTPAGKTMLYLLTFLIVCFDLLRSFTVCCLLFIYFFSFDFFPFLTYRRRRCKLACLRGKPCRR